MAGLQVGGGRGGIGWQSPPHTLANKSMASKSLTPLLNKFGLHDMACSVPPTTPTGYYELVKYLLHERDPPSVDARCTFCDLPPPWRSRGSLYCCIDSSKRTRKDP